MANKNIKAIREWIIFFLIIGIVYFSGLYKPVVIGIQQFIISTGIFQPEVINSSDRDIFVYDMDVVDENGNPLSLEMYKDKVLFINFWATWCPPCLAEMPSIQKLYDKIDSENILFLMINVENEFQKALDFVETEKYTFPVYSLLKLSPSFSIESIPTTYVIGKKGQILVEKKGFASYDTPEFMELLIKEEKK